jgi:hypothetical protein
MDVAGLVWLKSFMEGTATWERTDRVDALRSACGL